MPAEKGSENHGNHAHPWDSSARPEAARGGPSWPGHASRRSAGGCSGGDGTTTAKKGRGGARKAKERAVDGNECVAGHREAEGPQQC